MVDYEENTINLIRFKPKDQLKGIKRPRMTGAGGDYSENSLDLA